MRTGSHCKRATVTQNRAYNYILAQGWSVRWTKLQDGEVTRFERS
jgi:hypothetical protein